MRSKSAYLIFAMALTLASFPASSQVETTASNTMLSVQNQQEFNQGEFNTSSADVSDNSGDLALGYRNGTAADSLIGYWRLDRDVNGDGDTVRDYSGENNDGETKNGVTTNVEGIMSTDAFKFDSSNQNYVSHPDLSSKFDDEATISLWLKRSNENTPSSSDATGIFNYGYNQNNDRSHYPWTDGNLYLSTFADSRKVNGLDNTGFDKTRWHHLVITTSPGTDNYRVYQNASLIAKRDGPASLTLPSNMRFGYSDSNYYFNGRMDEVRLYNRSLSGEEVKDLYMRGMDGTFEGNYTSKKIDTGQKTNWSKLKVDATIPSETSVNASFRALDSSGNTVDKDYIDLSDGSNDYDLNIDSSEDAELFINGTSSNVKKSWSISDFTVYSEEKVEAENTSLELKFNHSSGDDVIFSGDPVNGNQSFSSADFPYMVSQDGSVMAGVVRDSFLSATRNISDGNRLSITSNASSASFLIPFTSGGYQEIEDQKNRILNDEFIVSVEPSFSYFMPQEARLKVIYNPEIDLKSNISVLPGYHELEMEKTGKNEVEIRANVE